VAKVVAPMINDNLEEEECEDCRPVIFACENDFRPVRDLRKEVRPQSTYHVTVLCNH
jgi:hypothetical protein